jgi:hypothetical protein
MISYIISYHIILAQVAKQTKQKTTVRVDTVDMPCPVQLPKILSAQLEKTLFFVKLTDG